MHEVVPSAVSAAVSAAVAAGHALQHVAVLVETGDLDRGVLQLVLHVRVGGEEYRSVPAGTSSGLQ